MNNWKNAGTRTPSRRITLRPPTGKECGLAAGKFFASRQPGRKKYVAKPPPNVRLKAVLPRDVNETLAITIKGAYDHAVKLQCCTKIGKSEKIMLFSNLWAINFYVELYFVYSKK